MNLDPYFKRRAYDYQVYGRPGAGVPKIFKTIFPIPTHKSGASIAGF